MAKGKRAAALFEVIQAAKEREQLRAKGGGFLTPSWWFKGKSGNGTPAQKPAQAPPPPKPVTRAKNVLPPTPAPIIDEPAESETHSIVANEPEVESEEIHADDTPSGTFTPEPAPDPVHHDFVDNEEPALTDPTPISVMKSATPSREQTLKDSLSRTPSTRKPVKVNLDRGRQQIVFRLSFTSAAITSFAVLVVLGLAVLIGKSFGRGPSPANASIADIKNGKANPSVMSVFQGKSGNDDLPIAVAPAPKPVQQPQSKNTGQTKVAQANGKQNESPKESAPSTAPAKPIQTAGKRIVGDQYVVIQSYPDPEDANDAAAALRAAGIDATVEKIPSFGRWPCVVGTRGFDHTKNNPEFDAYIKSIRDVSKTFAGASNFHKFEPQVIGWKG